MLARLGEILSAGADLVAADARLAWTRTGQLGVRFAVLIALGVVAAAALCATLAGAGVLLAPMIGTGLAIVVVAGTTLLIACIAALVVAAPFITPSKSKQIKRDADEARLRFYQAVPGHQAPEPEPKPRGRLPQGARQGAREHREEKRHASILGLAGKAATSPDALAGAAFAAVSILGVRRSLSLARTLASAAATGAALTRAARQVEHLARGHDASHGHNGHAPAGPRRHEPSPRAPSPRAARARHPRDDPE